MSAAVRYDQLIPRLLLQLPGAMESTLLLHLGTAGRSLCNRTEAWRETLPAIDLVAKQAEYKIVVDAPASIIRVTDLKINTLAGISAGQPGLTQPEQHHVFSPPLTITLRRLVVPQDDVAGGLEITAALMPTLDCQELPGWFFDRYAEGLIGYVLNLMASQPKWNNPALAASGKIEWLRAIDYAIGDKQREYKNGQGLRPA